MLTLEEHADRRTISIESDLTIYQIQVVSEALLSHLSPDFDLTLKLDQVNEIDSAGVQLLMFVQQQCNRQATKLTLTDHSQAVLDTFEALNLISWFDDPILLTNQSGGSES